MFFSITFLYEVLGTDIFHTRDPDMIVHEDNVHFAHIQKHLDDMPC